MSVHNWKCELNYTSLNHLGIVVIFIVVSSFLGKFMFLNLPRLPSLEQEPRIQIRGTGDHLPSPV